MACGSWFFAAARAARSDSSSPHSNLPLPPFNLHSPSIFPRAMPTAASFGREVDSLVMDHHISDDMGEWAMSQQRLFLCTPTMHPKLVTTIRSILSPPQTCCNLLRPHHTHQTLPAGKDMRKALFPTKVTDANGRDKRKIDDSSFENETDQTLATTVPLDLIRNRRPFKCGFEGCNKTFKNPQTMKMHHKTHYAATGGKLVLMENSLSVGFSSNSKAGNNKKIPSRCPLCRRTFVGLYELRRHFGRKHSEGEKMHGCKKCGKKFYVEVDLRDHEKICGEPMRCKCGMKFAFKCNLVAHKRSHPECKENLAVHEEEEDEEHRKDPSQQSSSTVNSIPLSSSSSKAQLAVESTASAMDTGTWEATNHDLDMPLV